MSHDSSPAVGPHSHGTDHQDKHTQPHQPGQDPKEAVPELTDEQLEFLNSMFDLARQGREEELLGLIEQGIPVNLANSKGDTLLILATYNNHDSLVEALIARGADVDRLNDRGQSALTCAVFLQNEDTVRMILLAGADPRHEGQNAYAAIEMFGLDRMREILEENTRA